MVGFPSTSKNLRDPTALPPWALLVIILTPTKPAEDTDSHLGHNLYHSVLIGNMKSAGTPEGIPAT